MSTPSRPRHQADGRVLTHSTSIPRVLREGRLAAFGPVNLGLRNGPQHVERLRRAGLDDLAIADVIHAASFFNWANRLMLSLGEPSA